MNNGNAISTDALTTGQENRRLLSVLRRLLDDGPEREAIDAGEIDAIIDYKDKHVILFPVAERALRAAPVSAFPPEPLANAILAALPSPTYQRLRRDLEPVMLTENELLQESGVPMRYVYFPIDGVISLFVTIESRQILEVSLVGSEGIVGIPPASGRNISSVRAVVGIAGSAVRLPEANFREVSRRNPAMREELNRFTDTELAAARQIAACSAFHTIEQRFARRLLMIVERLHSDRFYCTHQSAASALGVRRESITLAARTLQNQGLISYRRGNIRILNRKGLESVACRCHARIESRLVTSADGGSG